MDVPGEISTGCPELDRAWRAYAPTILDRPGIMIPDTDEDLTWHAFLGHGFDMQGFRAAEFVGVDASTAAAQFIPLKQRGIGVPELAGLWGIPPIQQHLLEITRRLGASVAPTYEVLRSSGGSIGSSLADALERFPGRKTNRTIRALLQDSAALADHGYSFRDWLQHACAELGEPGFPPTDFRRPVSLAGSTTTLEWALRGRLEGAFYLVGPTLAPYMICDWQLWLWAQGLTAVFASFKLDSFHQQFVAQYGAGVIPPGERDFTHWWFGMYLHLPPRLANECIWLWVENGGPGPTSPTIER